MRSPYSVRIVSTLSRLGALECGFVLYGLRSWHIWKKQTALCLQAQVAREEEVCWKGRDVSFTQPLQGPLSLSLTLLMSSYCLVRVDNGFRQGQGQCRPVHVCTEQRFPSSSAFWPRLEFSPFSPPIILSFLPH